MFFSPISISLIHFNKHWILVRVTKDPELIPGTQGRRYGYRSGFDDSSIPLPACFWELRENWYTITPVDHL